MSEIVLAAIFSHVHLIRWVLPDVWSIGCHHLWLAEIPSTYLKLSWSPSLSSFCLWSLYWNPYKSHYYSAMICSPLQSSLIFFLVSDHDGSLCQQIRHGSGSTQKDKSDMCHRCGKKVYPVERLDIGVIYHRSCFKCRVCNITLNLRNFQRGVSWLLLTPSLLLTL